MSKIAPMVQDYSEPAKDLDSSSDLNIDRTRLAHERTLLSWIRTSTSLITFGFAIEQFFHLAGAAAWQGKGIIGPHAFGLTMITIGLMALLLATFQHWRDLLALRKRYPERVRYSPWASLVGALVAVLGLIGLATAVMQ